MKSTSMLTLVLVLFGLAPVAIAQRGNSAETLLGAGLHKEEVEDNCREAIKIYERVIREREAPRNVAARAQLHIGLCQERLGQREARGAFERVVSRYADQPEVVAQARARLSLVTAAPALQAAAKGPMRLVSTGPPSVSWRAITRDGRYLLSANAIYDVRTGTLRPIDWANTNAGRGRGVGPWPAVGTCREIYPQVETVAVSVDGKQLAYVCGDSQRPALDASELRVLPLNAEKGVPARVLLRDDDVFRIFPFGWSPNGRDVFIVLRRGDDSWEIAAVPTAGGARRVIKKLEWWQFPEYLSLSPDGRSIAYDRPVERNSRNRDLFLLASDGTSEQPLVQHPAQDGTPIWTPDGTGVVFTSDRSGSAGLWLAPVRDGKPAGAATVLRARTGVLRPLGFGPDGSLFYSQGAGRQRELRIGDVDLEAGSILRQPSPLAARTAADNSWPSFSSDGKSLAYISTVGTSRYVTLVLRSLETGSEQEIPTALIEANEPQWFPDGRSILVLGLNHAGQRLSLHRIDVQTGKNLQERVIKADDMIRVSPNGRTIYFLRRLARAEQALIAHDLESGRETRLFTASAGIGTNDLAVSPDGQRLAFVNFQTRAVTVVPASGGAPTALRQFDGTPPSVVRWSKDGRELVVWHGGEIWMVPADGGSARRVGTETLPRIRTLQPTGTQVAFTADVPGMVSAPEVWVDRQLVPVAVPSKTR